MSAIRKFQEAFNKVTNRKGDQWLEKIPAWTGNYSGVVSTGVTGMIYVRVDGQVAEVFNQNAPAEHNIPVLIGRHRDQPHLWQVIGRREVWSAPASPDITHHGLQHSFGRPDMTPIDRKQVMALTVMVSDAANFVVTVYGALVHTANGIKKIANQTVDLSSYVITAGAKYVNIESDDDAALTVNEGSVIGSPGSATDADIPVPADGKHIIATVLLYGGQAALSNNDIAVPMPLPGPSGGGTTDVGAAIHAAAASAITDDDEIGFWESVSNALKKITWANIIATLTTAFDLLYAAVDIDYSGISANDAATDVTGAELEELTDGSETTLHSHAGGGGGDGWTAGTGTWSYSSADDPTFVISVNNDQTGILSIGIKIKYTQTTVKYGCIVAVGAFSGGATLITINGGTDYDLANAAITNPYWSTAKAPLGFPMSKAKWRYTFTDTTQRSQLASTLNYYNLGSLNTDLPIGSWELGWEVVLQHSISGNTGAVRGTISTSNSAESAPLNKDLSSYVLLSGTGITSINAVSPIFPRCLLTVTTKTPLYFLAQAVAATGGTIYFRNDQAPLKFTADLTYL
jgi:hypothetical protein